MENGGSAADKIIAQFIHIVLFSHIFSYIQMFVEMRWKINIFSFIPVR